jgi:hypothetical protein
MSEAHEQPKKPASGRAILLGAGWACLGVFFYGLAEVLWARESGSTIELVWGVLGMVFGVIGAACIGRLVLTKRP